LARVEPPTSTTSPRSRGGTPAACRSRLSCRTPRKERWSRRSRHPPAVSDRAKPGGRSRLSRLEGRLPVRGHALLRHSEQHRKGDVGTGGRREVDQLLLAEEALRAREGLAGDLVRRGELRHEVVDGGL